MSLSLKASGSPSVTNLTLTSANIEYSHAFGATVKKMCFQNRGNEDLKFAFTTGTSGTSYFTLKGSCIYYEDLIHGPVTVYLQCATPSVVVEIISWTHID